MRKLYLLTALGVLSAGLGGFPLRAAADDVSYVAAANLPPLLLPPPPDEGGDAWKRNVEDVLDAQKLVTADDLTAIRDEQHLRVELMSGVIGLDFTREKFPRSYALLDRALATAEMISSADKQFWRTRRPYLADARVKLMVDRIDRSPSYPSGHTSGSRVLAEVLGMLYPGCLPRLRARADAIALHRVEAGAHYPSDIEGGRLLAMLVVGALSNSAEFQSDLAAAREETTSTHLQ